MTGTLTPDQVTQELVRYYGGVSVITTGLGVTPLTPHLANLVMSSGVMFPAFNSSVTNYTALVPSATSSITVTPTVGGYLAMLDPVTGVITINVRVLVNGAVVALGAASDPIPLTYGDNTITILTQKLSDIDGSYATTKTYTWTVNRPVLDAPEIGVRQSGASTDIPRGGIIDLGRALTADTVTRASLDIVNTGYADLTGVSVMMAGQDADEFRVETAPAPTVTGPTGRAPFSVRFTPLGMGRKSAVIRVLSNDADENPYEIKVTAILGAQAEITTPPDGALLRANSTGFVWDSGGGTGVPGLYVLWFGSAPGRSDRGSGVFAASSHSTTVTSPGDGLPVHVTLWTLVGTTWLQSGSYTFTDYKAIPSQLTRPGNGSALTSDSLALTWDSGVGVMMRDLYVGTTPGGREIYSGTQGTELDRTVTVRATGGKVYVTLWSLLDEGWHSHLYVFTTSGPRKGTITSLANGSTLTGGTFDLTWNAGAGVTTLWVYVGSTVGGYDLASFNPGATTARTVVVPQDGGPIYVTLWSLINGGWQSEGYWYYTVRPVSGSVPLGITTPANTSTLGSTSVLFNFDAGVGVTRRDLYVGSTAGGYDLFYGANETALSRDLMAAARSA